MRDLMYLHPWNQAWVKYFVTPAQSQIAYFEQIHCIHYYVDVIFMQSENKLFSPVLKE